jgi:hypothetical protein
MTLAELKAQFLSLMNNRLLTANASLQQTFIDQAIMRIQRDLRIPAMEKSVNVTISDTYTGLLIPGDFLELIQLVPEANDHKLRKCDITRALLGARGSGDPEEYARQGSLWVLAPTPVSGSVIRIDYYAELDPLVNPTDTNVVSEIAWDLIVNAALVQACVYYKDKRAADFETQYQTIFTALQDQADEDDTNGGSEVMPCYSMTFPEDLGL